MAYCVVRKATLAFLCFGIMLGLRRFIRTKWGKQSVGIDKTDCYFDPDCHSKVNWKKVGEMKENIFAELKAMKETNDVEGGVKLLQRMHVGFAEAGMPEDRIDYILTKWVEDSFPAVLDLLSKSSVTVSGFGCANGYGQGINQEYVYQGATKDGRPVYRGATDPGRYIYYDSYCADDTREPRWLLGGEPDTSREFNLNTRDGKGCQNDFSIVSDSTHLPGGQQKVAWNWCGDHGLHDSESVSIIYEIKGKAAAMPHEFEQNRGSNDKDLKCSEYQKLGEMAAEGCRGCVNWYPGLVDSCMQCGGACKKVCPSESTSECYASEDFQICHKACMYTSVEKEEDQCIKYKELGEEATKGCRECSEYYPGRGDDCMKCGGNCKDICPVGGYDCYRGEEFVTCHKKCMSTGTEEPETMVLV